jgi:1-acyl-sn-glycerol-3-phosphate acyltransferase
MPDATVIPIDGGREDRPRRTSVSAGSRAAGATGPKPKPPPRRLETAATPSPKPVAKRAQKVTKKAAPKPVEKPRDTATVRSEAKPAAKKKPVKKVAEPIREPAIELREWDARVAETLDFLRRRLTGEYEVDDFGFDPELTDKVLLQVLRPLYDRWFRVEARGLENVPSTGGALVVANHSGTIALDSLMTQLALHDHHPAHRTLRMLGANLVFSLPFAGELARKGGHTLACAPDAERLLGRGELVGVWPEGFKGVGKPFSERYKLQRFGRGGFVAAALRAGVPIIPTAIVGAEEIYPILGNFKTLARLLGMPYFPLTPTFPWLGPLGMIPLPSKWIIEFGEPIPTDAFPEAAADDPMLVYNLTDQVRETIQQSLYRVLLTRPSAFAR